MMRFLKLFWFDVKGYLAARSIIKKQKNTVDFNKFGLKVDWVCRVYTVINPLPEDKGDSSQVLQIKAQDRMTPIHRYMDKIGMSELVSVSVEKIPDTDSYLLVYYPIFRVITTWGIFITTVLICVIAWVLFTYL